MAFLCGEGRMRSTASKAIQLLALFMQEESWTRQAVAAELGMSPNAAYDFLKTLTRDGVLVEFADGAAHRFRLSDGYKDNLQRMLQRATAHDVEALIQHRLSEASRAMQVQLEHLRNELLEALK